VSAIVARTDRRGVITFVNDKFVAISGYEREELIGKTHSLIKSNYHPPEFFQNMWKTIGSGSVWRGEVCNRNKSGELYWVDSTIVPLLNEQGVVNEYIAVRFDITDKKSLAELNEETRARAMYAEKMASMGELAAGIAHELGNPLAAVKSLLEVIESQFSSGNMGPKDMFVRKLREANHRIDGMSKTIRAMLSYARDGSSDEVNNIDINLMLAQVIDQCGIRLNREGVDTQLVQGDTPVNVRCRETELIQVFTNLILNAVDAICELDEKWIKIKAGLVKDNSSHICRISVTDSGLGIKPEIVSKMFNPFFTTKEMGKGTGLGLSISKKMIEANNGTLTVDPNSVHTCFVVELPVEA
jgi:PAS domain S-box-containing protein